MTVYILFETGDDCVKRVIGLSSDLDKVIEWHQDNLSIRSWQQSKFLNLSDICE